MYVIPQHTMQRNTQNETIETETSVVLQRKALAEARNQHWVCHCANVRRQQRAMHLDVKSEYERRPEVFVRLTVCRLGFH